MKNELVINVTSQQTQIAFLENDRLVELTKEKSNVRFTIGDIYISKVNKIIPGLNAAFVKISYKKDAFLHYLDLGPQFASQQLFLKKILFSNNGRKLNISELNLKGDIDKKGKISEVLRNNDYVLFQITKEPISTKGPRITSEISIAGRNMVLLPFSNKVSISQKIKSIEERKRLTRLLESIKPKNFGVIIRTASEGKKVAVLDQELRGLTKKWKNLFSNLQGKKTPQLLANDVNRTTALVRDILNASFEKIYVNDENVYNDIKTYISEISPDKLKIVKLISGKDDLFDKFNINSQIKKSFGKTVTFKDGGYLVIEHPEAFHVIDVNSGQSSKMSDQEGNALMTNLTACEEIARQLRLRDMGGIIVIDFIDMRISKNRKMVMDKMKSEMARDRSKHRILSITRFGLMQITRQRVRPEMHIEVRETCPTCQGSGKISPSIFITDQIENNISYIKTNLKIKDLTLKIHPFIAAYIQKGFFSIRRKWQSKYKIKLKVTSSPSLELLTYKFYDSNNEFIKV